MRSLLPSSGPIISSFFVYWRRSTKAAFDAALAAAARC